ncbi:hypothetical protein ABK040_007794 [Willaertia magna]
MLASRNVTQFIILFFFFSQIHFIIADTISSRHGKVLLGGNFSLLNKEKNQTIYHLGIFDFATNSISPFYFKKRPNGCVNVIIYEPRCDLLFIGGNFTEIDGMKTGPVAVLFSPSKYYNFNRSLNVDENSKDQYHWKPITTFHQELYMGEWSPNAAVYDLDITYKNVFTPCNPHVVMVGAFTKAAGIETNNIITLNTVEMRWNTYEDTYKKVKGVPGRAIYSVFIDDSSDGIIYAAGDFPGYFVRYRANQWETILSGQLNGPVKYTIYQKNHIYEDVFLLAGSFTAPTPYIAKVKPQKTINNARKIYATSFSAPSYNITQFPNVDSSDIGIRFADLIQDRVYVGGLFKYSFNSTFSVDNLFAFNVNSVELYLSNDVIENNEFKNKFVQTLSLCKPPYAICERRSRIVTVRNFTDLGNNKFGLADAMTILLYSKGERKATVDLPITIRKHSPPMEQQDIYFSVFLPFSASARLFNNLYITVVLVVTSLLISPLLR